MNELGLAIVAFFAGIVLGTLFLAACGGRY
jgi:hypothetical protein